MSDLLSTEYARFLGDLKQMVRAAQTKAALAVNRELIALYWELGRSFVQAQRAYNWGDAFFAQTSRELMAEFPGQSGFSPRNLYRMRAFYLAYSPDSEFLPQPVAEIPWGHNALLIEKIKENPKRLWYAQKTGENGWSRAVLEHQIELGLFERQTSELKSHNFARTLPAPDSDLAAELLKDTYIFDFLSLSDAAKERELEAGLLDKIRDFLLELGQGFSFLGSQYHLEVGGQDFYVDLLFYHYKLRRLVAIDLKVGDFSPAFVGQMGFYQAVLDDKIKHPDDGPTIGLILCKSRNHVVAQYALAGAPAPLAVADYKIADQTLENALPAPDDWARLLAENEE